MTYPLKRRSCFDISPEAGDAMRAVARVQTQLRWETNHTTGTKRCIHCEKEKDVKLFRRDTGYRDGRESVCMSCRNIRITRTRKARKGPK